MNTRMPAIALLTLLPVLAFAAPPPPASDIPSVFPVRTDIYHEGWTDFNKNGAMDVYEDPTQPVEKRVEDLLRRMTVEEKTCQLATLYGYGAVLRDPLPTKDWLNEVWKDGIANIDEHLSGRWSRGEGGDPGRQYTWPSSRAAAARNEVQRFFVEQTRLGIPVDFTNEGIRGVRARRSTAFPIPLGQGCAWDPELARLIGEITGREACLLGFTNVYAPILDISRDQRWGRMEESFGESDYLMSALGVEVARGIQSQRVVSTAKHFAVYSFNKGAREGQSRTDPRATPREVEELALAPFRNVITKAGILGVMASYNDYNGVPVEASPEFLIGKLRKEYGFKGYVVSDSDAVEYIHNKHGVARDYQEAVAMAVNAGMNVRTTFTPPKVFIEPLRVNVAEGKVSMKVLDDRVRDVLRVKFWLGLFDDPYRRDFAAADAVVGCEEHRAVALRAARECLVLLKNKDGFLPLSKDVKSVAVIGPNAGTPDWCHLGYGPVDQQVETVVDGVKRLLPDAEVLYAKGCDIVDADWPDSELVPTPLTAAERKAMDEAVSVARRADAVILVVGDTSRTSGESRTRTSLDLPGRQETLVREVFAAGKPTALVLIGGRPATINWEDSNIPGILFAPSPGPQGGRAIAEALFGDYNPGGKLSCTFPKSVGQIPLNFPTKPMANDEAIGRSAAASGPLYPFGHGLSYTTFAYSDLTISPANAKPGEDITVTVTVANTGGRAGDEVVQLYIRQVVSSVTTYEKNLRGFRRIHLAPGEKETVTFRLAPEDLRILARDGYWRVEPGVFRVMVGSSSEDIRLKGEFTVLPGGGRSPWPKPLPLP
jgi:beta-glucosidase